MSRADDLTIAAGTPGIDLMVRAGRTVFDRVIASFPDAETIHILCGTGNNGGDGYVVAELLRQAGRAVTVSSIGSPDSLKGDAALARRQWRGDLASFHPGEIENTDLIIDALFGAGLDRDVTGEAAEVISHINSIPVPVVSIDLPSGICGLTGKVRGVAIAAEETVTFFRKKPGHLLEPGKSHCGEVTVTDIGIDDDVFREIRPDVFENSPALWGSQWPGYAPDGHKYGRGHVIVLSGGPLSTGASRLAAQGALRVGAGLTSLVGSREALMVQAAHVTAIMLKPTETLQDLRLLLSDLRLNSVAAGPGLGLDAKAKEQLDCLLDSEAALTLDADALTLFAEDSARFFDRLHERDHISVLTPHAGEFARLFGATNAQTSKLDTAREAAHRAGAVLVMKGADTVIADPDGRAAINGNAPPWLATAGSGDVLTGMIAGLRAQGMPAFEAACAGVWLHGEAGRRCGAYLISEDLEQGLAEVLDEDSNDWG
ncbi:MAG: bifunctional ADP-dependent NAD(P)H-hydrate dehydratase/NAD(P)H-hydrate epimerase [Ponticaulis sp.]|nr:bifunctional ADP-dependent NAD(P)H-hydrate dehydratase/NAD(P)H-hydrate epimerase [Ponticaulis sp.]|tara:strand:- start:20925 stop:22382 length:1458 start_codon:yes stop_codon:yes gene_type:complete